MKTIVNNRKAFFEYNILEKITAGIKLVGSEIKSIRAGKVSIGEAYCYIENCEIFIKGMYIAEHKEGGKNYNHLPLRNRKLLLNKKEIIKFHDKLSQKGLTIVPLQVILTTIGFVKVEIGLGKGKNNPDKREALKEKDIKRDIDRNL